MSTPLKKCP